MITSIDDQLVDRALALRKTVRRLNLSNNLIAGVARPAVLERLRDLVILDLSGNQLTTLGPELGSLPQLQVLDVARNKLTSIEGLRHCPGLRKVSLAHNALATTQDMLAPLQEATELNTLMVGGNPAVAGLDARAVADAVLAVLPWVTAINDERAWPAVPVTSRASVMSSMSSRTEVVFDPVTGSPYLQHSAAQLAAASGSSGLPRGSPSLPLWGRSGGGSGSPASRLMAGSPEASPSSGLVEEGASSPSHTWGSSNPRARVFAPSPLGNVAAVAAETEQEPTRANSASSALSSPPRPPPLPQSRPESPVRGVGAGHTAADASASKGSQYTSQPALTSPPRGSERFSGPIVSPGTPPPVYSGASGGGGYWGVGNGVDGALSPLDTSLASSIASPPRAARLGGAAGGSMTPASPPPAGAAAASNAADTLSPLFSPLFSSTSPARSPVGTTGASFTAPPAAEGKHDGDEKEEEGGSAAPAAPGSPPHQDRSLADLDASLDGLLAKLASGRAAMEASSPGPASPVRQALPPAQAPAAPASSGLTPTRPQAPPSLRASTASVQDLLHNLSSSFDASPIPSLRSSAGLLGFGGGAAAGSFGGLPHVALPPVPAPAVFTAAQAAGTPASGDSDSSSSSSSSDTSEDSSASSSVDDSDDASEGSADSDDASEGSCGSNAAAAASARAAADAATISAMQAQILAMSAQLAHYEELLAADAGLEAPAPGAADEAPSKHARALQAWRLKCMELMVQLQQATTAAVSVPQASAELDAARAKVARAKARAAAAEEAAKRATEEAAGLRQEMAAFQSMAMGQIVAVKRDADTRVTALTAQLEQAVAAARELATERDRARQAAEDARADLSALASRAQRDLDSVLRDDTKRWAEAQGDLIGAKAQALAASHRAAGIAALLRGPLVQGLQLLDTQMAALTATAGKRLDALAARLTVAEREVCGVRIASAALGVSLRALEAAAAEEREAWSSGLLAQAVRLREATHAEVAVAVLEAVSTGNLGSKEMRRGRRRDARHTGGSDAVDSLSSSSSSSSASPSRRSCSSAGSSASSSLSCGAASPSRPRAGELALLLLECGAAASGRPRAASSDVPSEASDLDSGDSEDSRSHRRSRRHRHSHRRRSEEGVRRLGPALPATPWSFVAPALAAAPVTARRLLKWARRHLEQLRAAHEEAVAAESQALAAAATASDACLGSVAAALGLQEAPPHSRAGRHATSGRSSVASSYQRRLSFGGGSSVASAASHDGGGSGSYARHSHHAYHTSSGRHDVTRQAIPPPLSPDTVALLDVPSLQGALLHATQLADELAVRVDAAEGGLAALAAAGEARTGATTAALAAKLAAAEEAQALLVADLRKAQAAAAAERRAGSEALAHAEASRVRQVGLAKEAAVRAKSQATALEGVVASLRSELSAARDEVVRLEGEVMRVTQAHGEAHKKAVETLTSKLATVNEELELARRERDELVAVLRADTAELAAAAAAAAGGSGGGIGGYPQPLPSSYGVAYPPQHQPSLALYGAPAAVTATRYGTAGAGGGLAPGPLAGGGGWRSSTSSNRGRVNFPASSGGSGARPRPLAPEESGAAATSPEAGAAAGGGEGKGTQ